MGASYAVNDHKTVDLTELVGTQLFRQVSMAQVAAALRYCPALNLTAGEKIIVPGQVVDKVYVLLRGRLQVFDGDTSGTALAHIREGECVGLSSFVDRQPCHVSIVSEGVSRLLVLDDARLMALLNTPTGVSRNLLFILMNYLRDKVARAPEPAKPQPEGLEPHHHIDTVTGLHNQRWLDEMLDRMILRAATDRVPLSVVAVDLKDRDALVSEYGQEMFDLSMRELARTMTDTARPTDRIAHHATGRFIILLPDTDQAGAETMAERLQKRIDQTDIVIPGVCSLPPMKVVVGCIQMKSFVSGRKLIDDAFAALQQQREALLAELTQAVAEAEAAQVFAAEFSAELHAEPVGLAEPMAITPEDEALAQALNVAATLDSGMLPEPTTAVEAPVLMEMEIPVATSTLELASEPPLDAGLDEPVSLEASPELADGITVSDSSLPQDEPPADTDPRTN